MCSWRIALLERFWQARHPPRYAAFTPPSSPSSRHSSNRRLLRRIPAPPPRRSRQNLNALETVPINWQITWQTSLPASLNETGSFDRHQLSQDGGSAPLTPAR